MEARALRLPHAAAALCLDDGIVRGRDRHDINAILASGPALKTIYEKRLELNAGSSA